MFKVVSKKHKAKVVKTEDGLDLELLDEGEVCGHETLKTDVPYTALNHVNEANKRAKKLKLYGANEDEHLTLIYKYLSNAPSQESTITT